MGVDLFTSGFRVWRGLTFTKTGSGNVFICSVYVAYTRSAKRFQKLLFWASLQPYLQLFTTASKQKRFPNLELVLQSVSAASPLPLARIIRSIIVSSLRNSGQSPNIIVLFSISGGHVLGISGSLSR